MAATGYVDLQVNGFRGVDFSSPELTVENFRRAAEGMLQTGTELFLPTLVTSPMERYRRNCDIIRTAVEREGWQRQIPGVHLEGPFLTPEPGAIGCHNPEWVIPPDPTLLDALGDIVRMITVAAERPGMPEFIHEAAGRGILVSLSHQLATTNELRRAAAAGARTLTHLGNGIPNQLDRHRNPIWSGLACDALTAMIITDGHHLPPEVIQAFLRCKGADRIIVTSDASPATGLPPGRYRFFGGEAILEPGGRLRSPSGNCLAGSASTLSMCMEYLRSLELLTPEELDAVGRRNALRLLESAGTCEI